MTQPIPYTLSPEYRTLIVSGKLPPPRRAHPTDAGIDLWCVSYEGDVIGGDNPKAPVYLEQGKTIIIDTGLSIAIPKGWVGLVKDRSSVAKMGLTVVGGVVDSDYRGVVKVMLTNVSYRAVDVYHILRKGLLKKACAQLVIVPCWLGEMREVKSLDETERGVGGFGSSDKA